MDPGHLAVLRTPEGATALAAARDALAAGQTVVALRARGVPPATAAAAFTQAELRARAVAKFGDDAHRMFFTRTGLQQATRAVVADRRAARLRAAGVRTIADLGCGIGADALAFARAGIRVYAVEADPATAAVAEANAQALGLTDLVAVHCGDATRAPLDDVDAVFCDPARRSPQGRRVFDPAAFSPPWEFVAGLPRRVPRTVLKLAPGIDHALVPPGAEAEWVSVDGEVVEATFWCGPLARAPRRASLLRAGAVTELTGTGERLAPVDRPRAFLYDPDGAVVRAHLVAEFAATVDGVLADPMIAYVYADSAAPTPYAHCFQVDEVLAFSVKRLRAALRERGVGRVEIRKRGSALDPAALRRDLRLAGDGSATVVLTRVAGAPVALLCHPAAPGAGPLADPASHAPGRAPG